MAKNERGRLQARPEGDEMAFNWRTILRDPQLLFECGDSEGVAEACYPKGLDIYNATLAERARYGVDYRSPAVLADYARYRNSVVGLDSADDR